MDIRETTDVMQNTTVTKKTETIRQSQAERLNRILQGCSIPAFVIDTDHRITCWNRACERITDKKAEDMIGTSDHGMIFYGVEKPTMADFIVNRATAGSITGHYRGKVAKSDLIPGGYEGEDFFPHLGDNGKVLFFTASPLTDKNGDIEGAIETILDVTKRRHTEQSLRASTERYLTLFESESDAIFLLDDDIIIDCNRKALEIFRCSREEIVNTSVLKISTEFPSEEGKNVRFAEKLFLNSQEVKTVSFEWQFQRVDSTDFTATVRLNKLTFSSVSHILMTVRDISAEKQFIETVRKQKRELDEKTAYLEKVNLALKSSLDYREIEKKAIEESIFIRLKKVIFPYLEELDHCRMDLEARACLNVIKTNLSDIVSPFSQKLFSSYLDLTPTEIKVADFIRAGKKTKEIAEIMCLSPGSIQWHRKNIRKKLGLGNKKINLTTFLSSLET